MVAVKRIYGIDFYKKEKIQGRRCNVILKNGLQCDTIFLKSFHEGGRYHCFAITVFGELVFVARHGTYSLNELYRL